MIKIERRINSAEMNENKYKHFTLSMRFDSLRNKIVIVHNCLIFETNHYPINQLFKMDNRFKVGINILNISNKKEISEQENILWVELQKQLKTYNEDEKIKLERLRLKIENTDKNLKDFQGTSLKAMKRKEILIKAIGK